MFISLAVSLEVLRHAFVAVVPIDQQDVQQPTRGPAEGEKTIHESPRLGTITASLYQVAATRTALLSNATSIGAASPTDPLSVMTFALTGLWFLIANLLLWRIRVPRLLVLLGFVAAADLFAGFVGALSANDALTTLAAVVAGAVGGPIYWLWLGVLLRRLA